jgi:cell division protein FtsQ
MPVVVWRGAGGLHLLDPEGYRVDSLAKRTDRPDLPLIAGEGASAHVGEALRVLAAAAPLRARLRGLTFVGNRRWDLVLDRDQRIQLPEERPVPALEQVLALHQAQGILDRDVAVVDMRSPRRPTLRLAEAARDELRRIRHIETGALRE